MMATNRRTMFSRCTPTAAAVLKATSCVVIRTSVDGASIEGASDCG
jgi:hypothetical protein